MTETTPPDSPLHVAMAHHAAGRAAEAERAYRAVLAADPGHPGALHLLGMLALQHGRPAIAAQLIGEAVRRNPGNPAGFSSLAQALHRLGQLGKARTSARLAVALDPGFLDGLDILADILSDRGEHGTLADTLGRRLALTPWVTEPRMRQAHALLFAGRNEEAREALMTLLGMTPLSVAGYTNLGVALRRLGRTEEAIAAYRSALGFASGEPGTLNNLGISLQDLGRYEEAAACFRLSIAEQPDGSHAYLNLGLVARDEMRVDNSIRLARRAATLAPALAEAHTALGHGLLIKGEFREGFAEYEWRSRMADFASPRRDFASPVWDGSPIAGRTLLVHDEQGMGDTIMFARYAALLQAQGARVYLDCGGPLVRLLSSMPGIAGVVSRQDPAPPHDFHVSLASLPHRLRATLYTIPAPVAYLRAEPALVESWGARLGPRRDLRIGLVWAGNPEFRGDRLRSPGLAAFRPLLDLPGVSVYGLQKGAGRDDLDRCGPLPANFVDLGADIADLADTAAIMDNLDLVVSSCTGPAHLAGALGRPVWTLLPFAPDWRWLEHGVCTPWYPTMRLFRQERRGDWSAVVARLRGVLESIAG
ncbi:tetratricopeptide repeat protein [Azospirillum agricola]|uniref:tetratricopeptide repeat protein n=1 Tax=Azospirillum agricola TaxID=1720247 RepID=UPI000A0EF80E|nr:tetratricopeptide repeat protein [Azospirillum agricola]SMH61880.1 Tetratricopeptide (TPR) repeat [Azospirillum lipoferum]